MATLDPLRFEAPPVNPAAAGLFAAVNWQPSDPPRFFPGVEIRGVSYGGEDAFGVWDADWCAVPGMDTEPRKEGERPEILDPFAPMTVWAYDECDLMPQTRRDVEKRAAQILRIEEQTAVEREFADRLIVDAGSADTADDFVLAIGTLEGQFALTNTTGFIHLGAQWAAVAASSQVLSKSGTKLTTPLGHTLIFGGGYVEGLDNTLVGTSQPYGWRTEPQVRTAIDERRNIFAAIAERTVAIGYEAVVGAVTIT